MYISNLNSPSSMAMELNFQDISKDSQSTIPSTVGPSSQNTIVPSNSWADTSQVFTDLTTVKSDMPLDIGLMNYSRYQTNISDSQIVHISPKTVVMRSVSTMTDLSFADFLLGGNNTSSREIGKISNESKVESKILLQSPSCSNYCSNINVKNNASAMSEYLNRFKPSFNIKEFTEVLKQQNIEADFNNKVDPATLVKDDGNSLQNCTRTSDPQPGSLLYCCPECHMVYARKDSLEHHLLEHHKADQKYDTNIVDPKRKQVDPSKTEFSEERPFVCELCSKSFKRSEHLKRHFIIHTGSKTHVCVQCGKAFSRKDHLTKHLQSHANRQAKSRKSEPVNSSGLMLQKPPPNMRNILHGEDK